MHAQVDPHSAARWRVIGTARIDKVIEKRVGDIGRNDMEAGETYSSAEEMLQTFQQRYGSNVGWNTAVKMIHFDFEPAYPTPASDLPPAAPDSQLGQPSHRRTVEKIILYADGGSRGNPGPSACGYVLLDEHNQVLVDKGVYLGITTNNQAEYQGLKFALEEARNMQAREVAVRLDSLLVINQMKGIFKVKNRDLWPIHEAIKQLVKAFDRISFTHVPREFNKLADAAVNRALDEAKSEDA